jgi:hypothetical protein
VVHRAGGGSHTCIASSRRWWDGRPPRCSGGGTDGTDWSSRRSCRAHRPTRHGTVLTPFETSAGRMVSPSAGGPERERDHDETFGAPKWQVLRAPPTYDDGSSLASCWSVCTSCHNKATLGRECGGVQCAGGLCYYCAASFLFMSRREIVCFVHRETTRVIITEECYSFEKILHHDVWRETAGRKCLEDARSIMFHAYSQTEAATDITW